MVNSDVEIQTNVFLTVKSVMLLLTVRMVLMSPCLVVSNSSLPIVTPCYYSVQSPCYYSVQYMYRTQLLMVMPLVKASVVVDVVVVFSLAI